MNKAFVIAERFYTEFYFFFGSQISIWWLYRIDIMNDKLCFFFLNIFIIKKKERGLYYERCMYYCIHYSLMHICTDYY